MKSWRSAALDLLLWGAMLAFLALGQFYFQRRPAFFWDGVSFHLLGLCAFLFLLYRHQGEETALAFHPGRAADWAAAHWFRVLIASLGVLSAMLTLRAIRTNPPGYWSAFGFWLGGMALYAGAFLPSWRDWRRLLVRGWEVVRRERLDAGLVVLLTGLALGLRAVDLDAVPPTLAGDEGSMGLEAFRVLDGQLKNMFVTGWLSHPTLYFFILAGFLWLFGPGMGSLRLFSALVGTATIPLFYLMLRRLFGRRLALAGVGYLVCYHFHIHFSRLAINNIEDPFFFVLTLYLLYEGMERRGGASFFALAGLSLGLAQYFYTGTRLIPLVVAAYLGILALREREFLARHSAALLVFLGGAAVAALPLAVYFWHHPNDFQARANLVAIIQSGWLRREVKITGKGPLELVAQQFLRSLLAFNFFPDRTAWYGLKGPLLDFVSGMAFIVGLAYAHLRSGERRYLLLLSWFWLAVIVGGMLTDNPPSSMRLVNLAPVVSLLVVVGLEKALELGREALKAPRLASSIALGALVAGLGLASVQLYFYRYQATMAYGSFNAEVATALGKHLAALGKGYRGYFFGAPRMYYGFGSIPFLAPEVEGVDVVQPLGREVVKADKSAAFIFLPERSGELAQVQAWFPGGQLLRFQRGREGPELFLSYQVERAKLEGR